MKAVAHVCNTKLLMSGVDAIEIDRPLNSAVARASRLHMQHQWPCRHFLDCVHKSSDFKESEKTIVVDVCSNILVPLCNEVILERRYREDLARMQHPSTFQVVLEQILWQHTKTRLHLQAE